MFEGGGIRAETMPVTLEAALPICGSALSSRTECCGGEYRTDLFEPPTIELLLGAISEVFQRLSMRPPGKLDEVKVTPPY